MRMMTAPISFGGLMSHHLLTLATLPCAVALYALGMQGGGALLFVMAAALEFWLWVRVIRGRRDTASTVRSIER
jgi:hypothetical protein